VPSAHLTAPPPPNRPWSRARFAQTGNDFDWNAGSFADDFSKVEFVHDVRPKDFLVALRVKPDGGAAGRDIAANGAPASWGRPRFAF
jgi:hypothetical protein